MLCYVMLCYVMLCYVMLCYVSNISMFKLLLTAEKDTDTELANNINTCIRIKKQIIGFKVCPIF